MIREMDVYECLVFQHQFADTVEELKKKYPVEVAKVILCYKTDFIDEAEARRALVEMGWIWEHAE